MKNATTNQKRIHRHKRIRARVQGTGEKPRLSVFHSNKHSYAQLVDDTEGHILALVRDTDIKKQGKPVETAKEMGKLIAKKAQEKNITSIVFDRSGYKYHGNTKAIADGAREGGLAF